VVVGVGVPPSAICSSWSYFSMSSVLMYMERQMGQLVLRRTNHETRHSEWNSCPQMESLRMVSVSGWVVAAVAAAVVVVDMSVDWAWSVVDGGGEAATSEMEDVGESFAGSGGEGAWRVERHMALADALVSGSTQDEKIIWHTTPVPSPSETPPQSSLARLAWHC
jgi:hypothetical protein